MKRRRFLEAGCACCAGLALPRVWAQTDGVSYAVPRPFVRPDNASDEGGLWAMMDREEKALRRSALLVRDETLKTYVSNIACRLAGDHCPDIRVYLVRTPHFNASMAPNGMMQVWTGLLLRVENEAQLAAVLGHEIGHFLQRHSLARLRDIKEKAAASQVLGLFGAIGALGQIAVTASAFGYQRDHEREADRIGALLMHRAGYPVDEASKVWAGLQDELKVRDEGSSLPPNLLFATHPPSRERQETLATLAQSLVGGANGAENYVSQTSVLVSEWIEDEIKRGQYAESIALFTRLIKGRVSPGLMTCNRGEAHRLRAQAGDHDLALVDYREAVQSPTPVAKAWRGIGLIERQRQRRAEAAQAFSNYLALAADAPDAALIQSYVEELKS
jgi:predicted Zn-dependent protease